MVNFEDLTGIEEAKRRKIIECLDSLLTFQEPSGLIHPIITGYNCYNTLPCVNQIVTFIHMQESELYKEDMIRDLISQGYNLNQIQDWIRSRITAHVWGHKFKTKREDGTPYKGLRIRDFGTGLYLKLQDLPSPLSIDTCFDDPQKILLAENECWQLDIPFRNKKELLRLVELFLQKSGEYVYTSEGNRILETKEERNLRNPWRDSYETPVLLLGNLALQYEKDLPSFAKATKLALYERNNEISFIINKNLGRLKELPQFEYLLNKGFEEEFCLGNKPFIIKYVDQEE